VVRWAKGLTSSLLRRLSSLLPTAGTWETSIITVAYTVEMGGGESGILLLNEMKQTKT